MVRKMTQSSKKFFALSLPPTILVLILTFLIGYATSKFTSDPVKSVKSPFPYKAEIDVPDYLRENLTTYQFAINNVEGIDEYGKQLSALYSGHILKIENSFADKLLKMMTKFNIQSTDCRKFANKWKYKLVFEVGNGDYSQFEVKHGYLDLRCIFKINGKRVVMSSDDMKSFDYLKGKGVL